MYDMPFISPHGGLAPREIDWLAPTGHTHLPALRAQGASLFHRSYLFSKPGTYHAFPLPYVKLIMPDLSDDARDEAYWVKRQQLWDELDNFTNILPMFVGEESEQVPTCDVGLYAVHTMTYACTLQLLSGRYPMSAPMSYHSHYGYGGGMGAGMAEMIDPQEWYKSQIAVNLLMSQLRQMHDRDYEFLDPLVAVRYTPCLRTHSIPKG